MRSSIIFLFYVALALAADSTNYNELPMDYFDDNFKSNLKVGPDSTFSFNFEQIRRDQPPQIEMREENVGRYINTRSQTTTPVSIFSMKADRESQHVYPTIVSSNNYPYQGHSNEPQGSPVPPPPKFAISRPHNNEPSLQRNSAPIWNVPAVHQNVHTPPHVPSTPTPLSQHVQWTEPPKRHSPPSPNHALSHSKGIEGIHFAPSASYVSDSITNNVPRQPPSLPSRGNHKFAWNDIKKQEEFKPIVNSQPPQPSNPSTPQSIHNKPPPPVPTLSPWYDNFGK
ncbi:jg9495 [Pararge aegeria aegeria]|uniref:Jg9495 protein n=1 Tax=Pararge aegeria aegeria TaxID=348720 RepID=A0A8S4RH18_9NEOP|nr:jg9495 [Pararge aegeria aegeria]